MSRIEACRICLITEVKLERIQGPLENKIQFVFGHHVSYSSDLPDYICYECVALVAKYNKFRKKYLMAQSLLFNILQNHGVVTEKEIKNIDRNANQLSSNLIIKHIENESQCLDVKIECDPMGDIFEMTIEDEACSSDDEDISLKTVEQVSRKRHILNIHKKKTISEIKLEESSAKKKRLQKNSEIDDLDCIASRLTNGREANTVICLKENECGTELTDEITGLEEHSPTAISINILENQHIMINNQREILSKLAEFTARFEDNTKQNTSSYDSTPVKINCVAIDSKKELDDFENDLNDPEKKKALHNKYSIFFKGKGNGVNCAYTLIDALFSRKFLTTCSWSGGSRGEELKIPFRAYKNTISFLYELCQECDSKFSLLDCYDFLKCVLKNSIQRFRSKGLRSSTKRRRFRHLAKEVDAFENDSENTRANEQGSVEET